MAEVKVTKFVKVQLELDEEEASNLLHILRNVGGNPNTTGRGHVAKIINALQSNGILPSNAPVQGSIYFL